MSEDTLRRGHCDKPIEFGERSVSEKLFVEGTQFENDLRFLNDYVLEFVAANAKH
jgi:hypothetical protein